MRSICSNRCCSVLFTALWVFVIHSAAYAEVGERAGERKTDYRVCKRVELGIRGTWVNRAAWDGEGARLVLPDVLQGSIYVRGEDGKALAEIRRPGQGILDLNRPSRVGLLDGALVVEEGDGHLVWLNEALEPYRGLRLDEVSFRGDLTIRTVFKMAFASDGDIFVYGDASRSNGAWLPGFFRIQLDPKPRLELLLPDTVDSRQREYFTSVYSYVATVGNRGYAMVMADPAYIVSAGDDLKRLAAFPAGFRNPPALPDSHDVASMIVNMNAMERMAFAAGLYGWKDYLYVLTREPREDGGTRWSLHRIDPR
ncbi:MAG: hypothetical protein D6692_11590, partial [Planctomycetota bacterium]